MIPVTAQAEPRMAGTQEELAWGRRSQELCPDVLLLSSGHVTHPRWLVGSAGLEFQVQERAERAVAGAAIGVRGPNQMLEGGPLMAMTRHNVKPRSECHRREESKVPKGPSLWTWLLPGAVTEVVSKTRTVRCSREE